MCKFKLILVNDFSGYVEIAGLLHGLVTSTLTCHQNRSCKRNLAQELSTAVARPASLTTSLSGSRIPASVWGTRLQPQR